MTIHAAKGLEFPAVFVVNLHTPGRGGSPGVTVIDRSVDGEPEVAFRSTDGTKLEERREVEELRRLLYVAVTRARDALYLAGEVDKDAILQAPKRSLASLLPLSLKQAFTRAFLTDQSEVQWEAEGHQFAARVCPPRLRGAWSQQRASEPAAADGGQQPPGASSPSGPAVDRAADERSASGAPCDRRRTGVRSDGGRAEFIFGVRRPLET